MIFHVGQKVTLKKACEWQVLSGPSTPFVQPVFREVYTVVKIVDMRILGARFSSGETNVDREFAHKILKSVPRAKTRPRTIA